MPDRVHQISRWLVALSLVVMSLAGFVSNQLLDEDAFAGLIADSIERPEVRRLLTERAIDVAFEASDADALLADALPDDIALVAAPALEVSKPLIAQAGAELLGVDLIGEGLDAAARSIHRQTATAIAAEDATAVTINTLPVLVVVADELAGDVGARAAVGLELPASATSIDLGNSQDLTWTIVRSFIYVSGLALTVWVLALVTYFVSAGRGNRLLAARRLGGTYVRCGLAIAIVAWIMTFIAALTLEVALAPDEALSFGELSVGGKTTGGGVALAEVLFSPLVGSARSTILVGVGLVAVSYLFGSGAVAVAGRDSIRQRSQSPLRSTLRSEFPGHARRVNLAVASTLATLLIVWPRITLRVGLTLALGGALLMLALAVLTGDRRPAPALREFAGAPKLPRDDATVRSESARASRSRIAVGSVLLALVWPTYDSAGFAGLAFLISAAFAFSYWWELRPAAAAESLSLNAEASESGWSLRRKIGVASVVALGLASVFVDGNTTSPTSATGFTVANPDACNGLEELCDRPVNEVVFAGTHNSMSAAELGWELANHQTAIPAQLSGGIRALLIDVQYWPQGESLDTLDLDPQAAEIASAALAVTVAPEDGLWMCHKLCQLGGTPFDDFLADLRVFLETQPDEVLIIAIQDDAPKADIKAAIARAGIDRFAFSHEPGSAWPTLGELIATNQRLIFMAENDGDPSGWYQSVYDGNVSETGFQFAVVEDFDCAESRGGNDGDFFLINHWVETGLPVPSLADEVNSLAVLRNRVEQCRRDRDRLPGIIAVNFWDRGDLVSYVEQLNLADPGS